MPPSHPDFIAVQWWGSLGGFHGIEPAPQKPGTRGKHLVSQYFEAFPGHAAKLDQPLDDELKTRWNRLARQHGVPEPAASTTRGDWIRAAFLHDSQRVFGPPPSLHAADAPQQKPNNSLMLAGDWLPEDPHQIDHAKLPRVPSEHFVISDVRAAKGVNQHNYLAFHGDHYFAMWSDGPGIEDRVGQRVKYATSPDGVTWSETRYVTPVPPDSGPDSSHYGIRSENGMRWISRGFWHARANCWRSVRLTKRPGSSVPVFNCAPSAGPAPNGKTRGWWQTMRSTIFRQRRSPAAIG